MDRRSLLPLAPAAALWLTEQPAAAQDLDLAALKAALAASGLEFAGQEVELLRANATRALSTYAALRAHAVPLDTEPALTFHALLPGRKPPAPGPFVEIPAAPKRFAKPEDVAFWPLTDLAALLRTRRITSTALTRMYLDRLKRHGPGLFCVVTLTEELALRQAARADKEIAAGRYRGPLHGVPYGVKDLFATKGIPTTWGAEPFRDQVLAYDAAVVERLERAGAVLVAKLSMGALALGGQWFGGMTRNPWKTDKTSSGSSAGSASATAAGLVGFSIGTETLGSILTPSRVCGVTGLRPTFGRVSRFGAMSLCWTMDKVGPICRSAADCMLVLRAIGGPDERDGSVVRAPLGWAQGAPLRSLRIGIAGFETAEGPRKQLFEAALQVLRKAGAVLHPVTVPAFPLGAFRLILSAEAATAFDDITRDGRVRQLSGQKEGDWPNTFRAARLIPAVEYLRAMRVRTQLMQAMDALMKDYECVLTPPSSAMLTITNFTGHPQMTIPIGFVDGEPEAIHFTGRLFAEGPMARVAKAIQDVTTWHRQRPEGFVL
ncbi:MAG: amidase [Acidobacteria bacterium]|nr:amidase [Acidobacteriota bacterium]